MQTAKRRKHAERLKKHKELTVENPDTAAKEAPPVSRFEIKISFPFSLPGKQKTRGGKVLKPPPPLHTDTAAEKSATDSKRTLEVTKEH